MYCFCTPVSSAISFIAVQTEYTEKQAGCQQVAIAASAVPRRRSLATCTWGRTHSSALGWPASYCESCCRKDGRTFPACGEMYKLEIPKPLSRPKSQPVFGVVGGKGVDKPKFAENAEQSP